MFKIKDFLLVAFMSGAIMYVLTGQFSEVNWFLIAMSLLPTIIYIYISLSKAQLIKIDIKNFITPKFKRNAKLRAMIKEGKKKDIKNVVLSGIGIYKPEDIGYKGHIDIGDKVFIETKKRGIVLCNQNKFSIKDGNIWLEGTGIYKTTLGINPLLYPEFTHEEIKFVDTFKSFEMLEDVKTMLNNTIKGLMDGLMQSNALLLASQKDKEKRAR